LKLRKTTCSCAFHCALAPGLWALLHVRSPDDTGTYTPGDGPVSLASYVEDVERDPIVLFDGLTKSYRYPGWRIGWVVGPSAMVETMARTASAIDGGPSRAALEAMLAEG